MTKATGAAPPSREAEVQRWPDVTASARALAAATLVARRRRIKSVADDGQALMLFALRRAWRMRAGCHDFAVFGQADFALFQRDVARSGRQRHKPRWGRGYSEICRLIRASAISPA